MDYDAVYLNEAVIVILPSVKGCSKSSGVNIILVCISILCLQAPPNMVCPSSWTYVPCAACSLAVLFTVSS